MESDILEGWADDEILAAIRKAFGDDVEVNVDNVVDLLTRAMAHSNGGGDPWRVRN